MAGLKVSAMAFSPNISNITLNISKGKLIMKMVHCVEEK